MPCSTAGRRAPASAPSENGVLCEHRAMGLVSDVFSMEQLDQLRGSSAIGHVRYSTTGSSVLANAQPFVVRHRQKAYAVAHNGNLVNAHQLKAELEEQGSIFQSTGQRNLPAPVRAQSETGIRTGPGESAARLQGAFSMVVLTSRAKWSASSDPMDFGRCAWGV
jgi:amidophosphoribosyltransferase